MSSNRCFANISPQGIEMIEENRFESASLNGLSMPVLIQYEDGINEADAADGKIREPRAESREPRAESREPRAESREPRAESREPRAESREPRAESREPRAESREPRAESREPTASSCSPWRSIRRLSRCEPRRSPESSPAASAGHGAPLRSCKRRRQAAFARAASAGGILLLLVAGVFALALPFAGPAAAQEVVEVPRAWPLKPSGLSSTQKEFRLLFVTSTGRNASSSNIADYNSFVQGRAAAGHALIRSFSSKFRVVGSTTSVDARDNTSTTYTTSAKGVPIYWLNGDRVANDYEDFYDGSWDNKNGKGKNQSGTGFSSSSNIWSGTKDDGTKAPHITTNGLFSGPLGVGSPSNIRLRNSETLWKSNFTFANSHSQSMFALSPVFKLTDSVKAGGVSITSTPANASFGYVTGETIRVQVDFGEAMTVTGSPYLVLDVGGQVRRAVYESGTGTRYLVFAYGVARGDTDTNGVSLCSDTMTDANCGRIALDGGAIAAQSDSFAAELDLPSLGNQGRHKVDGTPARVRGVTITSTPTNATSGYATGETILVRLDFGEAVSVTGTGTPSVVLNIGRAARRATYASGSGTRYLDFEYTVQAGDFDSDGISLCSDTFLDRGCGRITLNGGSISAQSDSLAAELDLPALGDRSGHKVDATPVFVPNPGVGPMPNPSTGVVPRTWSLKPAGVGRGESFRLLFVSSTTRNATSADINDYNNHVIAAAGAGHTAIQALKDGFRVIASTEDVDATDNAGLTGTGVPIYWLGSINKVADDYADLLDSTWDNENATNELGNTRSATIVWTGSTDSGIESTSGPDSLALGGDGLLDRGFLKVGGLLTPIRRPLFSTTTENKTTALPLYALSQVLMVSAATPEFSATPEVVSQPSGGGTYRAGETIAIEVAFTEPVRVLGAPSFALTLGSTVVRARYVSGSGTVTLRFEYTVQRGDYDADGVSVELVASESPFFLDGAAIRAVADDEAADLIADDSATFPAGMNHKVDGRVAQAVEASISSSPARGSTYRAGETITVSLALNEAARVTGRPWIQLDVGGARRRADYVGPIGEATDALEFSYTVQSGDFDADGVALCASGPGCGLITLDGGTIRAIADEADANLLLPALAAQRGHKVDAAEPLPTPAPACSAEIRVPSNWALKPSGVDAGGKFRLLFVSSTRRTALSTNIADYNSYVQGRARAGHAAIQRYDKGFRVLGSTQAVNARVNTCTQSSDTDAAVYWLNGDKAADDYADFYNGSWDNPNRAWYESGSRLSGNVTGRTWTGTDNDGTTAAAPLGVSLPAYGVPYRTLGSAGEPLNEGNATITQRYRVYGLSQVFAVSAADDELRTTGISILSTPAIGDSYRLGETVEVEVTYSEAVTVRGTPLVGLSVKSATGTDDIEYEAAYVRGTGTTELVFYFTVPSGLKDEDGIELYSGPLRLNGGTITAVSDGISAAWNLAAERNIGGKVDSSQALTGGICDRTPPVRYAIVAAVTANDSNVSNCSQVTETHLAAVTGTIEVSGLTSIGADDFAGLSGIAVLNLRGSGIETVPAGLFDGLGSLTAMGFQVGLTHLPKDIFRGLGKLRALGLGGNRLAVGGLPDSIFEPLTKLTTLTLGNNPGFDSFMPVADAGPGGVLSAGQSVTLGGPRTSGGPWGSNVTYGWTQTDGDDVSASTVTLTASDAATSGFTVPALASATDVKLKLTVVGVGDLNAALTATSTAEFTIRALAPTGVAVVSGPVDGSDTYKRGEKIEFAVTFGDRVLVDTSLGTPALTLLLGSAAPRASYVRGTGTNRLVFAHTVISSNTDTDGISVIMNRLALHGGVITSVYGVPAILDHDALAAQSGHKVDGSNAALTGGICGRTAQVRDKLLGLVKVNDANVTNCSLVTTTHLAALTGSLNLDGSSTLGLNGDRMTGLKAGDFAGLTGITILGLGNNHLRDIPAGVFDPLTALTSLNLSGNGTAADDGLTRLPAGLFDRLTGLMTLTLRGNDLSSLPPRIFEKLTNLIAGNLTLSLNPGSADFVPTAIAGPVGGIDVASGGSVTLEVEGPEDDDLWGNNVKYAWAPPAGITVTYTGGTTANSPRPTFTAPAADGTHTFTLTVTGGGGVAATSSVDVRVAAGPKVVEVVFASQPTGGNTPVYAAGETIEVAVRFDREVTVDKSGGTPSIMLNVGGALRSALYLDGSGSRALTFGYVVQQTDRDTDGVDVVADSLALNGGEIAAVSDGGAAALGHEAVSGGDGQMANGGGLPVTGGVCSRTPAVAAAIVERVRADEGNNGLTCDDITDPHLEAITGRLDLSAQVSAHGRMTALKAGDFADLIKVTALDLDNHALRSFPAGIFGPLKSSLTELSIAYNQTQAADRLRSLPAGLFAGLTNLTTLRLEHNDLETLPAGVFGPLTGLTTLHLHGNNLSSLPDRIFQPLENLTTLTLNGNPGSATFLPVAVAGPEGGIDAKAGEEEVSLGGDASGPWGNNLVYSWVKATGTTVDPSATKIQRPTLTAPALAEASELEYELTVTARGTSLTATDSVTVRVAAAVVVSSVALVSTPVDGGDTYKSGENIETAVTFSQPVTVTVTETEKATLDLTVGTNTRQAEYVRGTGTNRLVFEYTVVQADADSDGISIGANSLALATGAVIVDDNGTDANLDHPALAAQSGHKVDGTNAALTGGICERTAQVRDKLLGLVKANHNTVTDCSLVDPVVHLPELTGTFALNGVGNPMTGLKAGDFAGLTGITTLALVNHWLRDIPAGVFDPLMALTSLELASNGAPADDGLTRLPAGLFDRLTGLTKLQMHGNDLSSLPPRIFDPLANLTLLSLHNNKLSSLPPRIFEKLTNLIAGDLTLVTNPGTARFVPVAKAGPSGGIDVASGGSVTLGVEGAENGYDDPWGKNVAWAWAQTAGTTVTYDTGKGAATARPVFTAPAADETLTFTLTVTGGGGVTATSTVHVRVGMAAMGPMPESAVVDGETLTLTYGEDLRETAPAPASDKGQVYLAVVSEPGARRNIETARPSAVEVKGRQVILTLDPPADFGDTVTLSYYPDNATVASRVRGLGGTLADGFTGLRVRNETPEGNTVQSFAFTGPAKTYTIGDTIGIELTFAEAVTVNETGGAPTLALEIGAASRKAAYVRGSGSAVLTFVAAAVVLGEEDTDGIAVEANGLEVPTGSSIVNTGDREAAILRHRRYQDPAYKVDAVRPNPTAASAAGPTVTVTWSEALDPDSLPTGAGGFTVRIGGTAEPAVRSVAIDGRTVTLALARGIRADATGVTVDYTPQSATPLKDRVGNAALAFTGRAVTPRAADNNKAGGRVTVSGSATVGQGLTATVSDVADPDGPPSTGYTFTWLRIDGSTETTIRTSALSSGVASNSYTLTAADAGKRIGVKVTFEDHVGNNEEFESDVFPDFGRIVWPADVACAMPDLGGRELVWTGQVGVGTSNLYHGFGSLLSGEALSDKTFSLGESYTIGFLAVGIAGEANAGRLAFGTTADLPATATSGLRLHVCGVTFHFGDGPDTGSAPDAFYDATSYTYIWTSSGLDWAGHTSRRVYLSKGDTRKPVLTDIVVDGATLTMIYDEKLKRTDPVPPAGQTNPYTVAVAGGSPFALSGIRAGVGSNGNQVTMTLDPPAEAGQRIGIGYSVNFATTASKVQDLADNAAAGFNRPSDLNPPVTVQNITIDGPGVESVVFAGAAQTYAVGDTIGVDVTFNESVTVTATSTAKPRIALEIGPETEWAVWKTGQRSGAVHRFEYTVAEDDLDTDGAAVKANSLETPTGSSIVTTDDSEDVSLGHGSRQDPARTVDGVLPTATAASAAGPTVTVTWSEALDEASVPTGAGGFQMRIGNANGPAVSAVSVAGSTVTLSLASPIADGTTNVTLEYTPPRSGAKIRDAAGNDAAAILRADALAVTVTPDTRAPEISGTPTVDGATLIVTFDEALDTTSVPAAPGGFTVTVTRGGNPVSGYTVSGLSLSGSGTVLTLTLAQAVRGGDTVTLEYTKPTTPLRDRASTPNDVANFGGQTVDNRTPSVKGLPVFAGAAQAYAIGDRIAVEVEFTEAVSVTTSSARPEVDVEVGANTRKARYVSGSRSARLRFEYEVVAGDADTDGIAILADALATPGGSDIRTSVGNRTVQLAHDAVAVDSARTVDGERPTAATAVAEGLTIEVTWSEALDEASVPTGAGGFRVRIGAGSGPAVTAVAVDGTDAAKLRLTLASTIADGTQDATLEYRPPSSGAKIRDAAGNDAERFTGNDALAVSVTPDTTAPKLAGKPVVNGTRFTLAFDEPLDEGSVPAAAGGFTVTVIRGGNAVSGHTVTDIAVSGQTVTLTLAQGVLTGDTVTLTYSPTSTPLRDRAVTPNDVAAFSGQSVDNETDALEVSLSTTDAVEGEDGTVTLTVAVAGGGTSGVAREITIAPVASPTALETEDWTLAAEQRSRTLGAGRRSATAEIVVVDDVRLEPELAETVSFDVTADGAPIGTVTLSITDDDKAMLVVTDPTQPVTEGKAFKLKLRLEPHPGNGPPVADDVCFLDFPVSATLTRAGDTEAALPSGAVLETDHDFAATSFEDCTREVTVSVPTLASDGVWMADRALTFALAPKAGSDERVEAGEELSAVVRDDTPPPGPMVTGIAVTPLPEDASGDHTGPYTKEAFLALADEAVHGRGTRLTFTLTFDSNVTVTPDADGALPELVLDLLGGERRAQLSGSQTDTGTLTFRWTVAKGDNDPDGIQIKSMDLNKIMDQTEGAKIRFAAGCTLDLPCDMDIPTFESDHAERYPKHRVRGGLHAMRLQVSGSAREGEPFTVKVQRDGGYNEAHAIVRMTDSGVKKLSDDVSNLAPEDLTPEELQELRAYAPRLLSFPFDADPEEGEDSRVSVQTVTPPGDGEANAGRELTFELIATDVGDGNKYSYWYETGDPVEVTVPVVDNGLATDAPSLSVGPADAFEEPDATLIFEVSLDPAAGNTVTVDYATRDGTATLADADYVATSGTLTFAAGETVKTVEVPVLDDDIDEGVETVWLVLSNPSGAVIARGENYGQIHNTDAIPKAWIARFGRTVAEQMLEAVEGRMRAAPAPGVEMALAGEQIGVGSGSPGSGSGAGGSEAEREARRDAQRLTDWLNSETGDEAQDQSRAVTPRDLLTGSSFTLTEETPGKDLVSFWGRGAVTSFDGREGDLTLDGEIATGMLGADWRRGRWTTGLILSHSSAEGGYSGAPDAGDGSGSPGSGSPGSESPDQGPGQAGQAAAWRRR